MISPLRLWVAAAILLLSSGSSWAEQSVRQGPWVLHYMTMNTTELTPEVAKSYGVTRSRKRGLLMLNLQRADTPLVSVDHETTGTIRNLIGQTRGENLRRVQEQDAIYTLVEFRYSHLETMRFDFEVLPSGERSPVHLNFSQQLYTPGR